MGVLLRVSVFVLLHTVGGWAASVFAGHVTHHAVSALDVVVAVLLWLLAAALWFRAGLMLFFVAAMHVLIRRDRAEEAR